MTELVQSFRPQNEELVAAFERYLIARNLARRTRDGYLGVVRKLIAFLGSESAATADLRTLRAFLREHQEAEFGVFITVHRRLALRAFYRFLCLADVVRFSPAQFLQAPKLPRRLPRCPSEREVEKLLAAANDPRERAILEICYASGLRLAEVAALRIEDVNLKAGTLRVIRGKGNKDRVAMLGSKAVAAIRIYLGDRKRGPVFLNSRGAALSRDLIYRVVRECARRAGLPGVHPHSLRHAFATALLDRGADIRHVQELLGHVSVSTTQRYTHLTTAKLLDVYARCHPHSEKKLQ